MGSNAFLARFTVLMIIPATFIHTIAPDAPNDAAFVNNLPAILGN